MRQGRPVVRARDKALRGRHATAVLFASTIWSGRSPFGKPPFEIVAVLPRRALRRRLMDAGIPVLPPNV